MRAAPKVTLTDEDRRTLVRWSRGRSTRARLVRRAQIVLQAAEGRTNVEIAAKLGIDRTVVNRWRRRFAEQGLAGIEKDAPRPATFSPTERGPAGASAEGAGASSWRRGQKCEVRSPKSEVGSGRRHDIGGTRCVA